MEGGRLALRQRQAPATVQGRPGKVRPAIRGLLRLGRGPGGGVAGIEPARWRIVNGKLYLNYDKEVQKKWEKDIPGNIKKADQNWPKVLE